ncbi:hypothetical protein BXZ70DRAFT_670531 [Cristinia sonorae]|uniref:HAUS augmin-like complex subunit 6 N-terminal domain-containing protein n=1 Tax=Cristinia sonorae TaxID=1940300 RepID=A0A8K0UTB1_9AGAR|nr:hypothetical protein BXZ70DRAFT_670531 [Cristinia sonorae]
MSAAIPASLAILIHLHLLNFQLKNAANYDENLFNAQKHGIGERSKALEDISYFLVTKIEGQKSQVKKILPTYPCSQPSDILAYRASLTKYLESLRNEALRPSEIDGGTSAGLQNGKAPMPVAWWWRDVVVRKSLLEECSGDRFERLLLALSTHALLSSTPSRRSDESRSNMEQHVVTSRYHDALVKFQAAKQSERSFMYCVQRRRASELKRLRERLLDPSKAMNSRYSALSTDRLVTLSESALIDLLQAYWKGEGGHKELHFLVYLAGLRSDGYLGHNLVNDAELCSEPALVQSPTTSRIHPLPVAAAHFPSHLQALRTVPSTHVISATRECTESASVDNLGVTLQLVTEKLSAEANRQAVLRTALDKARKVQEDLSVRLQSKRSRSQSAGPVDLQLRHVPISGAIFVPDAEPPTSVLSDFFIKPLPPDHESAVQSRATRIRETLKASWPAIPEPPSSSEPESEPEPAAEPSPAIAAATRLRLPQPNIIAKPSNAAHVKFAVTNAARRQSRASPRKSNVLMAGRARRSSAFSRRKSLAFEKYEVEKIADSFLDSSTSDVEVSDPGASRLLRPHSPTTPAKRNKITKGQLLTPRSILGSPGKKYMRPSFDIETHERAMAVELPRKSLGQMLEADEADEGVGDEENVYEGNSMTLKDILLQANATQYDLLQGDELEDGSFDW